MATNSTSEPWEAHVQCRLTKQMNMVSGFIIMFIMFFANGFIIVALARRLRHLSVGNLVILHLAVADFLLSVTSMPKSLALILGSPLASGFLCQVTGFFTRFNHSSSMYLITIMAACRCYAVIRPFEYRANIYPSRVNRICLGAWCLALSLGATPLFGWGKYEAPEGQCWCTFNSHKYPYNWFVYLTLTYVIPMIMNTTMLITTAKKLFQQDEQIRPLKITGNPVKMVTEVENAGKVVTETGTIKYKSRLEINNQENSKKAPVESTFGKATIEKSIEHQEKLSPCCTKIVRVDVHPESTTRQLDENTSYSKNTDHSINLYELSNNEEDEKSGEECHSQSTSTSYSTSSHGQPVPTSTSSHIQPVPTSTSRHGQPVSTSTISHVQPVHTSTSSHVQPVPTSTSSHVQPVSTSTSSHVQPVSTSTSSHVQPVSTSTSSHVQPVSTSTSSHVQPVPTSTSSHVQPVPPSTSIHVQPVPTSTSSHGQPVHTSTSSHVQPVTTSTSSHVQPVPPSTSIHVHPVPTSMSSHGQPVSTSTSSHGQPVPTSTSSHIQPVSNQPYVDSKRNKPKKTNNKKFYILGTLFITYVILCGPNAVIRSYYAFKPDSVALKVFSVSGLLSALNSLMNPILYGMLSKEIRSDLKKLFFSR